MQKVVITQVETHVTHSCNMFCESCTHFSQESMSGRETVETFRDKLGPWSRRLLPRNLLLLGGEPALNPDLTGICQAARELWSGIDRDGKHLVEIMLVTNGLLLHKHPQLPEVLKTLQDSCLDTFVYSPRRSCIPSAVGRRQAVG